MALNSEQEPGPGEIIFASLGEILGVTMGMCMSWQIPVTVLQPWYYLAT